MTSSIPITHSSNRAKLSTSSLHFPDLYSTRTNLFIAILIFYFTAAAAVTSPPTFTRLPRDGRTAFTYDSRESISLECRADGDPRPEYSWTKDGVEIDVLSNPLESRVSIGLGGEGTHGNLIIEDPDESDQGYYQCKAGNVHGVALSQTLHLKEAYLEQMPKVSAPRVRSVGLNSHVVLNCNPPRGLPHADVFWTGDPFLPSLRGAEEDAFGSMELTKRITQDLEGNLHILSVEPDDENDGEPYVCNAFNPIMRSIQQGDDQIVKIKENEIAGNSGPELVWGASQLNTIAMKGKTLRLKCIFAGTPVPEVIWRKKLGNPLPPKRTRYDSFNQELVILSVDFSDQGQYECSASNGIGAPKTLTITVQVQSTPFFTTKPNDVNKADEETYSLNCKANGNPPPTVAILRNGEEIDLKRMGDRYSIRGGNLTIKNLMKDQDTAVFQCNASNVHGYVFSNTYLNVLAESPSFTEPPEKTTRVVEDSDAMLKCRTFGAPKPKIKWSRGAQVLSGSRYEILDNGDLKILSVKQNDQGKYTCFAENKFGEISEHGELEIHKKTVIQTGPESKTARAKTSASFRCAVECDPDLALSITWFKDGEELQSTGALKITKVNGARSHGEASLSIYPVDDSHNGDYVCVATTDLDRVTATAHLQVQDVPKPPFTPTLVKCGAREAEISWEPNNDGRSPIKNYIVRYNTSFSPDTWHDGETFVEPGTFIAKIKLSPWANYTFTVIARNDQGISKPSPISRICSTDADTPDKNPTNVKGEGNSPNNLIIYWDPMRPIDQNGPGFYYNIKYRRQNLPKNPEWEVMQIKNPAKGELMVPNQETYVPYDIMVIAFNDKGQSKGKTVVYTGWSGEAMPSQAPTNFRCAVPDSPTTTKCTWDEVPRSKILGKPQGYKVQFWVLEEGENDMHEMDFPYDSTSGIINLLRPYSNIVLQIRVRNTLYESEPSPTVSLVTPEGRPSPVLKLKAIPLGVDQFKVQWQPPRQENGVLLGYKITYREVNDLKVGDEINYPNSIVPTATSARLVDLKEKTTYRITVRGYTAAGSGEENFCEERTTVIHPPEEPTFKALYVGEKTMNLTILPSEGDNPGSHFYVEHKRYRGTTWWRSIKIEAENAKHVQLKKLAPGTMYTVRVVAYNGNNAYTASAEEHILTPGDGPDTKMGALAWFIIILIIIVLLIIILIVVCLMKRNRGGKYPVQKKEIEAGCEPEREGDAGFEDFTRMGDDRDLLRGSQGSLDGSLKPVDSDLDSLGLYGDGEAGKFNEEGSFIGQYVPDSDKKRMADSREDVVDIPPDDSAES